MASEQAEAKQLEANQIVELAFQPASDGESENAKIIRRILRREIESLLNKDSKGEAHDLEQLADDLDEIADQLQVKISKDEAQVQEIKELIILLERESSEKDVKLNWIKEISLIAVTSTAVIGGLFSGVTGAIVGAAAVPFFLKVAEAAREKWSQIKRESKVKE